MPNVMTALANIGGAFFSMPQSLADARCWNCAIVPIWRNFGDCLRPVFSASCMLHVSALHPKFALSHTMCGSMVDIQSLTAEIRRGKKKKEEEETTGQKYNVRICYAGRPYLNNGN